MVHHAGGAGLGSAVPSRLLRLRLQRRLLPARRQDRVLPARPGRGRQGGARTRRRPRRRPRGPRVLPRELPAHGGAQPAPRRQGRRSAGRLGARLRRERTERPGGPLHGQRAGGRIPQLAGHAGEPRLAVRIPRDPLGQRQHRGEHADHGSRATRPGGRGPAAPGLAGGQHRRRRPVDHGRSRGGGHRRRLALPRGAARRRAPRRQLPAADRHPHAQRAREPSAARLPRRDPGLHRRRRLPRPARILRHSTRRGPAGGDRFHLGRRRRLRHRGRDLRSRSGRRRRQHQRRRPRDARSPDAVRLRHASRHRLWQRGPGLRPSASAHGPQPLDGLPRGRHGHFRPGALGHRAGAGLSESLQPVHDAPLLPRGAAARAAQRARHPGP